MTHGVSRMSNNQKDGETPQSHTGNHNFVQLSRSYLRDMRALARKSPVAHELLYYLVETMGKTTNAVVVSYVTLCEVLQVSRPTAARAVKILKAGNWIDAIKIGSATAYCVNEKVFWQSGRNQRRYAKFSATVIASETEQDKDYMSDSKHNLTYIPVIERYESVTQGSEQLSPPDQGDLDLI